MIKLMLLLKKRADLSAEQFQAYYERAHVPLIDRLLPFYSAYRRNYVTSVRSLDKPVYDYDVITELEFASQAQHDAWRAALASPDIARQVRADEGNFIAQGEARLIVVDCCSSDYSRR